MLGKYRYPRLVIALLLSAAMIVTFIPEQLFVYAEGPDSNVKASEDVRDGDSAGGEKAADNEDENPADQQKPDADENKAGDEDENPADQQKPGADENNDGDEPAPAAEKDEKADAGDGNTEKAKEPAKEKSRSAAKGGAGLVKGSGSDLTISSSFELGEDGTYIMSEAEQQSVNVSYSVEAPQDKVLVVEVPEYGVSFYESSLPSANNDISEVKLIDPHTFAIRLANSGSTIELTNTFSMKSVKLTNEQAAYLIDNGMQNTRIAVSEYTFSGDLSDVVSQGTKEKEEAVWTGKPHFDPDAGITATHTYKVAVTPVSDAQNPFTDYMFDKAGHYNSTNDDRLYLSAYKNGEPRFKLPEAYKESGALMEITGIRFYVPDDRLKLQKIGNTETSNGSGSTNSRDLLATDFTQQWGGWTVSEEKTDGNGKKYYELTPTSRCFNVNSLGLDAFYGGMVLTWKLKDPEVTLDINTDYVAENTVVSYKLPGTEVLTESGITGPEIKTFDVKYRTIKRVFNQTTGMNNGTYRSWNKGTDAAHDVVSGSIHRAEPFITIINDSYVENNGTHWLPSYTGPVTQTYEFPYQIQPRKIVISEYGQKTYSNTSDKSSLISITYTTYEGESGSLTEAEIQAANDILGQHQASSTFLTYTFPSDKHVRKVEIKWAELATEMRWYKPYDEYLAMVYSEKYTARTTFDYKVNNTSGYTDPSQEEIVSGITWAGVEYSETYDGSINDYTVPDVAGANGTERAGKTKPQYFWFRIKPQLDPYLYGAGRDNDGTVGGWGRLPIEFLNGGVTNIGNLGFYVGNYGDRQDTIINPVIDLSVSQKKQSYDTNWGAASCPRTTFNGISDDQLLAFLTGEFTAMPKLAGWTFEYTTKDHGDTVQTYTVAGDIPAEGRAERIPLAAGDCFTSLRLKYDGEADLSHDSEDDTRTVIWMMNNIKIKRLNVNPFTGEEISCNDDYSYVGLTLTGYTSWENCVCTDHQHDRDKTQWLVPKKDDRGNPVALRALLYSARKATYKETTNLKTTAIQNINQGGSTSCDFDLVSKFTTVNPLQGAGHYGQDTFASSPNYPWGEVNEAVFVEIVDDEFTPDLSTTKFMGYRADSAQVIAEVVTIDGKRFLKLRLADGVVCRQNVPHTDRNTNTGTITDVLTVGFNTLPGTRIGDHNPIGDIYYDASLLLKKYDAPNKTGSDYDRTKYVFDSSAIEDAYGLSNTDVTGAKLFKSNGSAFTVHVDISLQAGVDLAPGKNETTYDFGTAGDPDALRQITYYPGEEDSLNGLITLKGPGNADAGSIYDMEAYVIIPRIGTDITWTSAATGDVNVQANEELDLYLRKAVKVLSNNDHLAVTVTYTTETDPTPDSSYAPATEIDDWDKVTGIRVHIDEVSAQTAVNLRMDLRSDAKETLEVLTAYTGGTYRYKFEQNGGFTNGGTLHLCAWNYDNVTLKNGGTGSVFWDIYDENGQKASNNANEPFIKDVTLTLYDADGTEIDSAVTNANGAFTLQTYKLDAGQYIVIDDPVAAAYTAKLTRQSSDSPINSNTDSDFDRVTNKLTLGKLTPKGLNNISAGFVRLPAIVQPADVVMNVGETKDLNVLINEFVSNTNYNANNVLTNGGYKISFAGYDDTLATITAASGSGAPSLARNGSSSAQLKSAISIKAKDKSGVTTVTVTLTNVLGDEVTATFKITVNKLELFTESYEGIYDTKSHDGDAYATLNGTDKLTDAVFKYSINGGETWTDEEPSVKNVADSCTVKAKVTYGDYGTVEGEYTLTVLPAPATITANDKTKTYGDADPELTATEDGILEGDNINYKLKRETGENVKGSPYAITFEYEGRKSSKIFSFRPFSKSNTVTLGNYEVTFVDGELTIEPAAIIIKTPSKEKTYDGSPLTAKGSIKGLVNGETVTFTTTGKQTEVGSSENTYSLKWDGTAKKSNYTITEKLGTLTVTEAAGEDDDEEDDDTDEPGGDNPGGGNPGGGNPGGGNPVGNNPGPGGNGDGNGTIVTADNEIPDSAAPTTLIDDNAAPRAGNGAWALINLIAAILTAIGAIVAFFRRKQEEDEQETDKVDENDGDEADTRGRKMLAAKLGGVVTAIVSIIVFFLTEDMTLPMILVDKWTLLMIIFFAVQILTAILNKRASKDDDDEEDDGPAPETA